MSRSGSAVVDWLVFMQLALNRAEAVTLATALLEEGLLRTVGQRSHEALRTAGLTDQFMDDSTALYAFVSTFTSNITDLHNHFTLHYPHNHLMIQLQPLL